MTETSTSVQEFSMIINGERRAGPGTFPVINPATGEPFAEAPECSRDLLDEAMASAAAAFVHWSTDEDMRRSALREANEALARGAQEVAELLTCEQGKPLRRTSVTEGATEELFYSGIWLRYFADLELPREILRDDAEAFVEVQRKPLGVVAAITPWNYPLIIACWKLAPALRAGNTVVLKPSPYTPLSTLKMVELLNSALPPGVLNVVTGGEHLGPWLTSHPLVRKISFTGSAATGRHVATSAASDFKRLTLELGGNDAAIVLDDADPATVTEGLFPTAFENSGQVCFAVKRVYVAEALHDQVVEALAAKARAVTVGDGLDPSSELGPLNNQRQFDRVADLVRDAIADGGIAAAGGTPLERPGYFFAPTILSRLADESRIVKEEQFGPALPVISYRSVDEAIERANATSFGLSGSVWSEDADRATRVATQLEAGTTWVNTHGALAPNQPFGGHKSSGLGVAHGVEGLRSFTDVQVVHQARRPDDSASA